MPSNQAKVGFQARLKMKVIRKDGTVEYHETEWSGLGEEEKAALMEKPSFREWFKKQISRQQKKED